MAAKGGEDWWWRLRYVPFHVLNQGSKSVMKRLNEF